MTDFSKLRAEARRYIATEGCVPVQKLAGQYEGEDRFHALGAIQDVLSEHLRELKKAAIGRPW